MPEDRLVVCAGLVGAAARLAGEGAGRPGAGGQHRGYEDESSEQGGGRDDPPPHRPQR
jgi:hypothetical protein